MVTTIDVEAVARTAVVAALRQLHLTVVGDGSTPADESVIEAWKGKEHILVLVNAAVAPDAPGELAAAQELDLLRRAARADAEAWEARVQLGPDMTLRRLDWRPIEDRGPDAR